MSWQDRDWEFCLFRDLPGNNCVELDRIWGCPDCCPFYEDPEMEIAAIKHRLDALEAAR